MCRYSNMKLPAHIQIHTGSRGRSMCPNAAADSAFASSLPVPAPPVANVTSIAVLLERAALCRMMLGCMKVPRLCHGEQHSSRIQECRVHISAKGPGDRASRIVHTMQAHTHDQQQAHAYQPNARRMRDQPQAKWRFLALD